MQKRTAVFLPTVLAVLTLLGAYSSVVLAKGNDNFGPAVDTACLAFNGTTPFADQSCTLCHSGSFGNRVDPEWGWWSRGEFTNFCPEVANQAPSGVINSPAGNVTIEAGGSVSFSASGSDPDNNLPLSFAWNFGGGAPNSASEDPGSVVFETAGSYRVELTVSDSLGLSDPTPVVRMVSVTQPPPACTDLDGDGFYAEGGSCGPVDCDDGNNAINPDAVESCTDGIDNNCNGRVDAEDLDAVNCPVVENCIDNDGDLFSPEGGFCGPIDCDDFDASVNPSASENCSDSLDNNCNGAIDGDDPACSGEDCILAELLKGSTEPSVTGRWRADRSRLVIKGADFPSGDIVEVYGAEQGDLLGIADESRLGDGKWRLTLIQPVAVPCSLEVVSRSSGDVLQVAVANAPESCGTGNALDLQITKAAWNKRKSHLRVKGEGAPIRSSVTIRNSVTGEIIAAVSTNGKGKWSLLQEMTPEMSPCAVSAASAGQQDESAVNNAPENCDVGTGPEESIEIIEVDWDDEDRKLEVEGVLLPGGGSVRLINPATGEQLASGRSEDDGSWKFELEKPSIVPCRIRVESNGQTDEAAVNNAPSNCDEEDEPASNLKITRIEWKSGDRKLLVSGNGAPGKQTATLRYASTGRVIDTEKVEDDGRWKFEAEKISPAPCRVSVEAGGTPVYSDLPNAPQNCE